MREETRGHEEDALAFSTDEQARLALMADETLSDTDLIAALAALAPDAGATL